jgi:ABC-2 type transport system permease protein
MKLMKIVTASLKMIFRDKIALFWAMAFPLMFVALFGIFSQGMSGNNLGKLSWIDRAADDSSARLKQAVEESGVFELTENDWSLEEAKEAMRNNKVNFVLLVEKPEGAADDAVFPDITLYTDVKNQNVNAAAASFFDNLKRQFFTAAMIAQIDYVLGLDIDPQAKQFYAGLKEALESSGEPVRQEQGGKNPVKYFDMIFVGLVCLGIMNYAVTGFAIHLASLREQKILKRLLTTPLPLHRFMLGEILAYLVLAFAQLGVMLAVGVGMFGARIYAGWWFLLLLVFLGALLFLALGFFLAAFAKTSNAASGMANGVAIPLMFLGGVFFPLELLPGPFYQVFRFLPLAPMIQAMRSVCLEGDPVSGQLPRLAIMLGWLVLTAGLGLAFFRFGDE